MQVLAEPFVFRYLRFSSLDAVQRAACALEDGGAILKLSRWTRTLRFLLSKGPQSERGLYAECAAAIISHSRALAELDVELFGFSMERMIAAAIEAAIGTFHCLKLGLTGDTSPALWAAVGAAVHLRSLQLYNYSSYPFTDWEARGPWELPHLRRLILDGYWPSRGFNGMFTFLERCTFPDLQEVDICAPAVISLGDSSAVVRFLTSHPTIISLKVNGPPSLSSDIIQHALAETVTLYTVPDASAIPYLSLPIRTLHICTMLYEGDERHLLDFLEALTNERPLRARLGCVKLDVTAKDSMRSEILPYAQRLHKQSITFLDAFDQRYHV
jgi:hypothetical protein